MCQETSEINDDALTFSRISNIFLIDRREFVINRWRVDHFHDETRFQSNRESIDEPLINDYASVTIANE